VTIFGASRPAGGGFCFPVNSERKTTVSLNKKNGKGDASKGGDAVARDHKPTTSGGPSQPKKAQAKPRPAPKKGAQESAVDVAAAKLCRELSVAVPTYSWKGDVGRRALAKAMQLLEVSLRRKLVPEETAIAFLRKLSEKTITNQSHVRTIAESVNLAVQSEVGKVSNELPAIIEAGTIVDSTSKPCWIFSKTRAVQKAQHTRNRALHYWQHVKDAYDAWKRVCVAGKKRRPGLSRKRPTP